VVSIGYSHYLKLVHIHLFAKKFLVVEALNFHPQHQILCQFLMISQVGLSFIFPNDNGRNEVYYPFYIDSQERAFMRFVDIGFLCSLPVISSESESPANPKDLSGSNIGLCCSWGMCTKLHREP